MDIKINNKKLSEAVEGVKYKKIVSIGKQFNSLYDAEQVSHEKASEAVRLLRICHSDLSDKVAFLDDFGLIDVDKSKFHGRKELLNAELIVSSYAEPKADSPIKYNGLIRFLYNDDRLKLIIEYAVSHYIDVNPSEGEGTGGIEEK